MHVTTKRQFCFTSRYRYSRVLSKQVFIFSSICWFRYVLQGMCDGLSCFFNKWAFSSINHSSRAWFVLFILIWRNRLELYLELKPFLTEEANGTSYFRHYSGRFLFGIAESHSGSINLSKANRHSDGLLHNDAAVRRQLPCGHGEHEQCGSRNVEESIFRIHH